MEHKALSCVHLVCVCHQIRSDKEKVDLTLDITLPAYICLAVAIKKVIWNKHTKTHQGGPDGGTNVPGIRPVDNYRKKYRGMATAKPRMLTAEINLLKDSSGNCMLHCNELLDYELEIWTL